MRATDVKSKDRRKTAMKCGFAEASYEIRHNKTQAFFSALCFAVAAAVIVSIYFAGNSLAVSESYKSSPFGTEAVLCSMTGDSLEMTGDEFVSYAEASAYISAAVPFETVSNIDVYGLNSDIDGCSVIASGAEIFESGGIEISDGKAFSASDVSARQNYAVISRELADALFGDANAVDQNIRVGSQTYKVTGVFEGKNGYTPGKLVILPYKSARLVLNTNEIRTYALITTSDADKSADKISEYLGVKLSEFTCTVPSGGTDNSAKNTARAVLGIILLAAGLDLLMFLLYPSKKKSAGARVVRSKHKMTYGFTKKISVALIVTVIGTVVGMALGVCVGLIYLKACGVCAYYGCLVRGLPMLFIISVVYALILAVAPSIKQGKAVKHDV